MLVPAGVLAFCGVLLIGWLGLRAYEARSHLTQARRELLALERGLREGRLQPGDPAVQRTIAAAIGGTEAARRLTSDPVWRIAGSVPAFGCPLRSSAALASSSAQLARDIAAPLASLAPMAIVQRGRDGVQLDVASLRASAPGIRRMAEQIGGIRTRVAGTSSCGLIGAWLGLHAARNELADRTRQLAATASDLSVAYRLLPDMLGANGPRRYLLVVQNDAESRATGGVIGGFGFLNAHNGAVSLDARNAGTLPVLPKTPVLRLGKEFDDRYQRFGTTQHWGDANLTPDYPTAARIFSAMWLGGAGEQVDGVVTIDPTVLGYVVSQLGPVRMPDGRRVSGVELPGLLQSRIYSLLPTNRQRDAYFAAAGKAIYRGVVTSPGSPMRLLPALARSVSEGRLLLWSRWPTEQQIIAGTPLAGALPTTPGPYLGVISQNAAGSKLDYWLHRKTAYQMSRLPGDAAKVVVTADFTNAAPASGLPAYVRLRIEPGAPKDPIPGQNKLYVSVYAGIGAGFSSATIDDRQVKLESETERGHSVFSTYITLNPGQTRTLRLIMREPHWRPFVTVRSQPLINPERLTVTGAQRQRVGSSVAR